MTRRALLLASIGFVIIDYVLSMGPVNYAVMIYDDVTEMNEADYVSENLDDMPTEGMQTQRIVGDTTEFNNNNDVTAIHGMESTSNGNKAENGNTLTTIKPTEQARTTQRSHRRKPCFFFLCEKFDQAFDKAREDVEEDVGSFFKGVQSITEAKAKILMSIPNALFGLIRTRTNRDGES